MSETVGDGRCDPDAVSGGDEDAAGYVERKVKQKVRQYFPGEKSGRS